MDTNSAFPDSVFPAARVGRFLLAGLCALLLATGCDPNPMVPDAPEPGEHEFGEATTSRRVFTGRDSFGVALNAKIAGSVEQPPAGCWTLAGRGVVTHLGRAVVVEHTACVDPTPTPATVDGAFAYEGRTGNELEGTFEGTLTEGRLQANVTITEVDVQAVKEPPTASPPGGGTLTGTLTNTQFQYTIEGWLFQRTR